MRVHLNASVRPPERGARSLTLAFVRYITLCRMWLLTSFAERKCAAETDTAGNVEWPETLSFVNATGQCIPGFEGAPTRECLATEWSSTVTGSCLRASPCHIYMMIANCIRFQRLPALVLPGSRTPTGASPMPARLPLVRAWRATATRRSVLAQSPANGRHPLRFRAPVTCAAPATTKTPRGPPTRCR